MSERYEHTPGPWYADGPEYTHVRAKVLEYETNSGTTARPAIAQLLKFVPREQREANAKLIAAAPALADALEALLAVDNNDEVIPAQCRAQAALRAAGRLL